MRSAPQFRHPDDAARLRDALREHGYTEAGAREALGVPPRQFPKLTDIPRLQRRVGSDSPLHILCRLFLVGVPITESEARRAFEPVDVERLLQMGLVERDGDAVRRAVRLCPHDGLLLASDVPAVAGPLAEDAVMGIGGSTLALANAMVRRPVSAALDLGTGCGILALLAAGHAEKVWATDTNPRATAFAAFNAQLNGFDCVVCRTGSLFEPVADREFDAIVCSPPYVVSPASRLIYRDNALRGDEFCRQLLLEATNHLAQGGFAQVLLNWPHYGGQDWRDRFTELLAESGCDVWILCTETKSVEDYAAMWIDEFECPSLDAYTSEYDRWMRYYDDEGIEGVSGGLATLRRRSEGANWSRFDDAPETMMGPAGDAIALGFDLHDFVLTAEDEQVLDTVFHLGDGVRMHQESARTEGGWARESIQLRHTDGLAWMANADVHVAGLAAHCDGERPLRDLIADLADATGKPVDAISAPVVEVVRALIDRGLLVPASLLMQ